MSDGDKPSGVTGLVSRLFDYVDRPWKVLAVVVLVVVGIAGWIVYEKRNELVEYWMTPDVPVLKTANIPAALDRLVDDSQADIVQIWSVDLQSNTQSFIAARNKGGERPVIPHPRSLPIIAHISDAKALVDVLNGNPVCVPLTDKGTPLARRLAARQMTFGCAIPIPPGPESFVGVIYLAWASQPEQSTIDVSVKVAREVAGRLATH